MPVGVYTRTPEILASIRASKQLTLKWCKADGCDRHSERKVGYCEMHYRRWRRNGTTNRVLEERGSECTISGCDKPQKGKHLCSAHLSNLVRHGDPLHKRTLLEETKRKIGRASKGRKLSTEQNQNLHEALKRRWQDPTWRANHSGENSPSWQGGKSPELHLLRVSPQYKEWRLAVYQRDNFTCQGCRKGRGVRLQAHHIFSFALYPKLRFEVSNGITLCKRCHEHPRSKRANAAYRQMALV